MSPPQQPTVAATIPALVSPGIPVDDASGKLPQAIGQEEGDNLNNQPMSDGTPKDAEAGEPPLKAADRPPGIPLQESERRPAATPQSSIAALEAGIQKRTSPPKTKTSTAGEDVRLSPPHSEDRQDEFYLDPTPKTPRLSSSPSRTPQGPFDSVEEEGSSSEIQSIIDQFSTSECGNSEEDDQIPKQQDTCLEVPVQHPPRRSSLEPQRSPDPHSHAVSAARSRLDTFQQDAEPPPKQETPISQSSEANAPIRLSSRSQSARFESSDVNSPSSPLSSKSLPKIPPPAPDPEPDLPFDFHRFLEQLRHRTADPVAKFLRSFLIEFGKKQWMAHEQVKIINDFLTFIAGKMAQCEVWRGVSDAEFDNAREGMEKLVMNRLYSQTFSPAIPPPAPLTGAKGKRKNVEKLLGPGRRGQHQEDIERDDILGQKVRIYGWVQEEHLDIPPVGESGRRFLLLAQQELLKIKTYRAPRDKVICVLNCCKVIFGLLRNSKASDTSADSFVPLLIYVVLHANPEHLVSNVQYILRFRNQDKLGGEAGYYLSSLLGAIQFIENLDRTSLTVSDEEFERNVEAAVSVIAERDQEEAVPPPRPSPRLQPHPQISEKSAPSQPEVVPRNSIDAEYSNPLKSHLSREKRENYVASDGTEENTAVSGLLRTIQRPLSSLGRMFSDDPNTLPTGRLNQGLFTHPQAPQRLSPAVFRPPRNSDEVSRSSEEQRLPPGQRVFPDPRQGQPTGKVNAEDAAARQASAEAAEAQRIQRAEHHDVVETLAGMFPDLDKDVIDDVVRMKQGRVGLAVDACLALNT